MTYRSDQGRDHIAEAAANTRVASREVSKYLVQIAIVSAAQFGAGKLGDVLLTIDSGGIGPVWPASGIALGALLLWGYSVWPGVAAGAFLLAFLSPLPHWAAVVYAAGTTIAALIAAFLLRHVANFHPSLSRLRDVLGLIFFGALGSAVVSASIGASTLYAGNVRGWSGFGPAWLIYLLGDSMGVLLVTPVMLTVSDLLRIHSRFRIAEFVAGLLLLTAVCFIIFGDLPLIPVRLHILAFAVLPFVIGAAVRFGVSGAGLATLLIAFIATIETASGSGPFAQNTPLLNAVLLDVFFAVLSVSGLALAAAIAEREQAERKREQLVRAQAAMEARLRLATIVESSDDAIAGLDQNGTVTDWNTGAERLFGYSASEAVGKHISFLADRPEEAQGILRKIISGDGARHYDTVRRRKNGTHVEVSLTVSPMVDAEGEIVGVSDIASDVTERKRAEDRLRESEARYQQLAEQSRTTHWEVDLQGLFTYVSHVSEASWGYLPDEVVGRMHFYDLHPKEGREAFQAAVFAFAERKQPFRDVVHAVETKDGRIQWGSLDGIPLLNTDGTLRGYRGSCTDITERKQAEEALSGMSRKLIEAHEQERTRIGRELHDDIVQRLALLAVQLDGVQQDVPDSATELGRQIGDLRKQTTQITNDVQSLSHELHSSKLEYLGIVGATKIFCKEFGERQRLEIDFQTHDLPAALPTDLSLTLFRVLQEALRNATKHSGVKRFEVKLWGSSGEIHLNVSDLGVGFDSGAAVKSTGLGLTSMQERLRLVGGELSITSQAKRGTTIYARIPFNSGGDSMRAAR